MKNAVIATLLLLLTLGLAAGCTAFRLPGRSAATSDPLTSYRAAMAPSQQGLLDTLPPMPDYQINVRVNPAELSLTGRMTVQVPAQPDGAVPDEFYFRLYPLLSHYSGRMGVDLVTVNGRGAPFSYEASDTAVKVVVPPDAVQPGQPTTIGMQWRLKAQDFPEDTYHLFGSSGGVLSLPLFYPVLAVKDPGAPEPWRLDLGQVQGDSAFAQAATYQVTVTVPSTYTVVSTGSVVEVKDAPAPTPEPDASSEQDPAATPQPAPPWKAWRMISGPAHEFALFIGDQLQQAQANAGEVRVNSWYRPGDEATGRATAEYAAAALRVYSELFGPYPYAELDVVPGPLISEAWSMPVCSSSDSSSTARTPTSWSSAWRTRWLTSGGTTRWAATRSTRRGWTRAWPNLPPTSTRRKSTARRPPSVWRSGGGKRPTSSLERGQDAVVNQPVDAFEANYEPIVYGKAALFHYHLDAGHG